LQKILDKTNEFDDAPGTIVARHRGIIAEFAEENSANTFLLTDALNYVYLNNEEQVVPWMRNFLGILAVPDPN
jgi:hypothetical protein